MRQLLPINLFVQPLLNQFHLPLLRRYLPIQSGFVETLEDFFHPGTRGDTHLFQVVASKGRLNIAEFIEEGLDMLANHRGVTS